MRWTTDIRCWGVVSLALTFLALSGCSGGGGGDSGGGAGSGTGATGTQVVSALGTPAGSATTATIDSTGGTVADGAGSFALTIPAGALPGSTQITVTPLSSSTTPWHTTSAGFGISGLGSLTAPATLSIKYTGNTQNPSADTLGAAMQDLSGAWWYFSNPGWDGTSMVVTLDPVVFAALLAPRPAAMAASATKLDAASLWVFERITITGASDLFVNDTANYEAAACNPQALGNEALLSFTDGTCQTLEKSLGDVSWFVNGKPGGDSTVGTLENQCNGSTCFGHYTAPATVPSDNPVDIGVVYNVTASKISFGKPVTLHDAGKYSVKASFRSDLWPVCSFTAPTLMTDSLSFNLEALPPTPFYSVTGIHDDAAVFSQPLPPVPDSTLTVDPGPEIFLATTNVRAELIDSTPPIVEVTINGTGRSAHCVLVGKDGSVVVQQSFVADADAVIFQFDPDPKKFPGHQQSIFLGPWLFDVTQAF